MVTATVSMIMVAMVTLVTMVTAYPPLWPKDFVFSYAGKVAGYRCLQIREPAEPGGAWNDNYFCSASYADDPGMRWSYARPISGMRCTLTNEPGDPHHWGDNYLCVPHSSPYHFRWSYTGKVGGYECISWNEPSDYHWRDNYLCAKPFIPS